MSIDVSIIIVNWNSREFLAKCLHSIKAHTRDTSFEIIVIDSGSFDGCESLLAERHSDVTFIQGGTNLGFAVANNRAAQIATGDYLLFLNPDTELKGPVIQTLLRHARELPACGLVGCHLVNTDGSTQSSCIQAIPSVANRLLDCEALRRRFPRSRLWGTLALVESRSAPSEVEAISGACILVDRRAFEAVGRFSEDYFMYVEDMDLAHKTRAVGLKNYYIPHVSVTHHGGSSSEQAANAFAAVMLPEATYRFLCRTQGRLHGIAYRVGMGASGVLRLGLLTAASRRSERAEVSRRKWLAVIRWSIGRDRLVRRYYQSGVRH